MAAKLATSWLIQGSCLELNKLRFINLSRYLFSFEKIMPKKILEIWDGPLPLCFLIQREEGQLILMEQYANII